MIHSKSILCWGGLHLDTIFQTKQRFKLHVSNPVSAIRTPGGVAANIARNLGELKMNPAICSVMGDDGFYDSLSQDLIKHQVKTYLLKVLPNKITAGYYGVLDNDGELAYGLANMDIYDEMQPEWLMYQLPSARIYDYWIVDSNLPSDGIEFLAKNKGNSFLCVAPVSPEKAVKWKKELWPLIDLWIGNQYEASILSGLEVSNREEALEAAKRMHQLGIKLVVVTLAHQGVVMFGQNIIGEWACPKNINLVDSIGAGDSFYAGFTYALARGYVPENAITYGICLSNLTIESKGAIYHNLNENVLLERIKQNPPTRIR